LYFQEEKISPVAEQASWKVDDVANWLKQCGLEECIFLSFSFRITFDVVEDESTFRNHEMDGQALLALVRLVKTDKLKVFMKIMVSTLKVEKLGHQLKFLTLLGRM
jgi:hypothetical protein